MASKQIVLKHAWYKQPSYKAVLKSANLAVSPAFAGLIQKKGVVSQITQNLLPTGSGRYGRCFRPSAITEANRYTCDAFVIGTGNFTLFFMYDITTVLTASYAYLFGTTLSASPFNFSARHATASNNIAINCSGVLVSSGISGSAVGHYRVVVRRTGSNVEFFVNDQIGSATNSSSVGAVSSICINSYSTSANNYGTPGVSIYLAGLETKAWGNNDVNMFLKDPWSVFEPETIPLFYTVSSGGSTDLSILDALHSHSCDNLTFSLDTYLAAQDSTHSHSVDNLTLATGAYLALADSLHGHSADVVTLATDSLLAVAEAINAHAADNITLDTSNAIPLTTQDALHAHSADNNALTLDTWLAIVEAVHSHSADNVSISSDELLAIADTLHSLASDALLLSLPSPPGTFPTVDEIRIAVWQHVIESGISAEQLVRIMSASLAGTSQKTGSTITFKGIDGVTDRIIGSFDAENNRTGSIVDGN